MATKLRRVVTYHEGLPPIKSYDPLIICSCKIKLKPLYLHYHSVHGHQTWQCGVYNEELPSIMSEYSLIMRSCKVSGKIRSCFISITTRPMATKLGKVVTYYKGLALIVSQNLLNTWSYELTRQNKNMSTTTTPMTTKPGRVVTMRSFLP